MMTPNLLDAAKSSFKREVYGNSISPQETRKISNKQSNLTPKQIEKEQTKPKISRRKEIIKIRAEISQIEMKKTIAKMNKTKSLFFENINKIDKTLASIIKKKGRGFPGGAVVKNLPANAGHMVSSPGLGRSHMLWSN